VPADSSTPGAGVLSIPKGAVVPGVTFAGKLAGKQMYLLPSNMNPDHCWVDSQAWTGSELFFGISSINWTNLNNGSLNYDPLCLPSPAFVSQVGPGTTGNFNIYRAKVVGSNWVLDSLPINTGQTSSIAAAKLSGSTLIFIKFEKVSAYGNIYLSQRTGDNAYSAPVAFSLNSATCDEDNPFIYASGTKIIFESSRTTAAAGACGSVQRLWATTGSGNAWAVPTLVNGTVTSATQSVTQPWLDSTGTQFYWTNAGADCAGGVTTCIKTASGSGTTFAGSPTQLITPTAVGVDWYGGGMLGLVGQYTEGNGYAFVACGIVVDVDPSGSTVGLIFGRFRIDIHTCVIPL
jgi:hypothetical protein